MKKLLRFAVVVVAVSVLFSASTVSAQKNKPMPKAPPPYDKGPSPIESVYRSADALSRLNDTIDRLLNPNRKEPQQPQPGLQPVREGDDTSVPDEPPVQVDPPVNQALKRDCEKAVAQLQDSMNRYFKVGEQGYDRQISLIIKSPKLSQASKQGRILGLNKWWNDVKADQKKINAALTEKARSCADTRPHPEKAWSLVEGERRNAQDAIGVAKLVYQVVWNPPPSGAFRSDQLLTLIQQPRILP